MVTIPISTWCPPHSIAAGVYWGQKSQKELNWDILFLVQKGYNSKSQKGINEFDNKTDSSLKKFELVKNWVGTLTFFTPSLSFFSSGKNLKLVDVEIL